MSADKLFIGLLGVTGLGFAYKAWLISQAKKLVFLTTINVQRFDGSGAVMRINTRVKNPTNETFIIKQPYVTLLYKGQFFGDSRLTNKDITFRKYDEAIIEPIDITVPYPQLVKFGLDLISAFATPGSTINLEVISSTLVDLGMFGTYPYSKPTVIPIKR